MLGPDPYAERLAALEARRLSLVRQEEELVRKIRKIDAEKADVGSAAVGVWAYFVLGFLFLAALAVAVVRFA